jgi:hypothetical protein
MAASQASVVDMIEGALAKGDSYGALQLSLSKISRSSSSEAVLATGFACAREMARSGALTEMINVVSSLVSRIEALGCLDKENVAAAIGSATELFAAARSREEAPEQTFVALKTVSDILTRAYIKASGGKRLPAGNENPLVQLHRALVPVAVAAGKLGAAIEAAVLGDAPAEMLPPLVRLCSAAFPHERPVVLLRAVLSFLALGNLRASIVLLRSLQARELVPKASDTRDVVVEEVPIRWEAPHRALLRSVVFLQRACTRGSAGKPLFELLWRCYAPVLTATGDAAVDDGEMGRLFLAVGRTFFFIDG